MNAATPAPTTAERLHGLDALRAIALLLGETHRRGVDVAGVSVYF